uniref:Ig-like domain-containing protein n=1 Tax=Varanus komodoensis TaxID=61221 RepID=A0A8D2JFI4_VARKO
MPLVALLVVPDIPRWVSQQIGGMANMNCYQNFTDHSWMYWYQQKAADQPLRLIGTLIKGSSSTLEEGFDNNKFVIQTEQEKHFSLQIGELNPEDATMYFCASRDHSAEKLQELPTKNRPELHFGNGTRLTVLESSKPPKVTVFSPSACELQKHQKATIVCLVTDFYPDHVSVTWTVNGEVRTEGVRTEDSRKEGTKTFSLISRLRISSNEWQNSGNWFQCSVEFYNEKESSFYNASTTGVGK